MLVLSTTWCVPVAVLVVVQRVSVLYRSCNELFHAAVTLVLKDDGFSLPSNPAIRARELAKILLEWCLKNENKSTTLAFSNALITSLQGCFGSQQLVRAWREHMWEGYYKLLI